MMLHESESVELKGIYTPDFKKKILAFANTNGGTIYIGVQDNGEIIGLDDVDFVMQQVSNTIRDSIRPDVTMYTRIELVQEEKKNIVKLTVNQGTKKP